MVKKLMLTGAIVFALGVCAFVSPAAATHGDADHCPNKDNLNKVESASSSKTINNVVTAWSGDPGSITFTNNNTTAATVTWCAKGGNNFSGTDKNTHLKSTIVPAGQQVTAGPFGTAISYLIVYSVVVEQTEEPVIDPENPNIPIVPETPRTPGQVLGDATTQNTPQVIKPVGGVNAGAGGSVASSLYGLGGSLTTLSLGIFRLRRSE